MQANPNLVIRPVTILLVEDSQDDVDLTRAAFREGKLLNSLIVASDGVEALDYLHQRGSFAEAQEPDLILLDLNLPRKDGREVLEEIKTDERLKHIPVVVLTTSKAEQDILQSYQLQANSYITKPVDLDQFFAVVRSLESYWLTVVELPPSAHK